MFWKDSEIWKCSALNQQQILPTMRNHQLPGFLAEFMATFMVIFLNDLAMVISAQCGQYLQLWYTQGPYV